MACLRQSWNGIWRRRRGGPRPATLGGREEIRDRARRQPTSRFRMGATIPGGGVETRRTGGRKRTVPPQRRHLRLAGILADDARKCQRFRPPDFVAGPGAGRGGARRSDGAAATCYRSDSSLGKRHRSSTETTGGRVEADSRDSVVYLSLNTTSRAAFLQSPSFPSSFVGHDPVVPTGGFLRTRGDSDRRERSPTVRTR